MHACIDLVSCMPKGVAGTYKDMQYGVEWHWCELGVELGGEPTAAEQGYASTWTRRVCWVRHRTSQGASRASA